MILELLQLYRAGSRYEPTQGFELTQGFERTRGGPKIQKNRRFALGLKFPPGVNIALGVKICPGVAVQFPVGFSETNRGELGRIRTNRGDPKNRCLSTNPIKSPLVDRLVDHW